MIGVYRRVVVIIFFFAFSFVNFFFDLFSSLFGLGVGRCITSLLASTNRYKCMTRTGKTVFIQLRKAHQSDQIRSYKKFSKILLFYLLRVGLGSTLLRAYRFGLLCFVVVLGSRFLFNGGGCIVADRHGASFQRERGSRQVAWSAKVQDSFFMQAKWKLSTSRCNA